MFTNKYLKTIDKILDKAVKNASGLIPSFPTEAIYRPTKEMGLGYAPTKDRATQMVIKYITGILNKPTDRGYIAHAHTTRVANTCQHWPTEAHEAIQAKLPIIRVLSYMQNIPGAELLEHVQNIQPKNHVATSMRTASTEIDKIRAARLQHIPKKSTT